MKRKLLSYCALIAVCSMLTACNGSSDNAKSTDIQVEKVAEPANSASSFLYCRIVLQLKALWKS